jgi:hypothetical protein
LAFRVWVYRSDAPPPAVDRGFRVWGLAFRVWVDLSRYSAHSVGVCGSMRLVRVLILGFCVWELPVHGYTVHAVVIVYSESR